MSDKPLSVYEAAPLIGVSVHTVRRWCKDFAAHLDEGANPEMGTVRRLSARDIAVLSEVTKLRGNGLSVSTINQQLAGMVFAAPIIESHTAAQEGHSTAIASIVIESHLAPFVARLDAIEAQRPTWRDMALIGVALFIAGLIIGLAVWWF